MSLQTPPVENPIILNLTSTLGFILIGIMLSFVIWGVTCMQTFMYFSGFPDDHKIMKSIIFFLWAFDTANVALLLCAMWPPLIGHWGDVSVVNSNLPDLLHHNWLCGIMVTAVQFVFLWRIWRLGGSSNSRWVWVVIPIVSLLSFFVLSSTIAYTIIGLNGGTLATELEPRMKKIQVSNRSCTAVADIIICMSLIKLLLQNGLPRYYSTRRLLYRSIIVTINTGLWTAILAIVDMSLMAAQPLSFVYCIIEFPLPSFYLVTLISNLNAREYVRGRRTEWNEYLTAIDGLPSETMSDLPRDYGVHVLSDIGEAGGRLANSHSHRSAGTIGTKNGSTGGNNTAFETSSTGDFKV